MSVEKAVGPDAPEPPPTRLRKFGMFIKVVELRLRFIALMAVTGLTFAYWDTIWNHYEKHSRPPREARVAASDSEFFCPMHPTVIQAEPGSCPICGMPLSKRRKGDKETLPPGVLARVALAPHRLAQAGIQTTEVAFAPLSETVTAVGSVEVDERRLRRISSKTKGMARVEKLLVNFTGIPVNAGDPLAEVYSPELYQATQELLIARKSLNKLSRDASAIGSSLPGNSEDLIRFATDRLRLSGITSSQIEQILREGKAEYRLPILSPIDGVVIRKLVVEGEYVNEGQAMFEVADLTRVWVKARVFENQFPLIRVGQSIEASVEAYPGESFSGKVAFIDPILDARTRTVTARFDLENEGLRLRPGMFAAVTLKTPISETPAFRLKSAARAATSGARLVSLTIAEQKICPVTALKLGAMGEPVPADVDGGKVWTCCAACPPRLRAQPAKYLARLAPAPKDQVLAIPESAVIDTGTKKVVYVETAPGVFEGREVLLGSISGGRYPVLDGLSHGEKVATSGAFLIDAENRLNPGAVAKTDVPPSPIVDKPLVNATPAPAAHKH